MGNYVLSHYYETHVEHIFEDITYITKKTPNLVAKILATKFGFVSDWLTEPLLRYCQSNIQKLISVKFSQNTINFIKENAFENDVC